jgi:hypothetical protein
VGVKKKKLGGLEEEIFIARRGKKSRTSEEHSEDSLQSEAREVVCTCCWRFAVGVKEKKRGASSGRGNYIIT